MKFRLVCLFAFCATVVVSLILPTSLLAADDDTKGEAKSGEKKAAAQTDIARLLGQEIIGPKLSLAEVKQFCTARVRRMPEVTSAEEWTKAADEIRRETLERVVFRGEAAKWRDAKTKVEWLEEVELPAAAGYKLRRLRYESIPGLWIPALLYEPEKLDEKAPVFLHVNGHDRAGKAGPYKQIRCINLAKRGVICLNVEWINMGQLNLDDNNHYRLNQIDLCGTSGIAVHFLGMTRGLDILLAHKNADPERVGVAGLSGGGWQTIFVSGLDPRVTLANPVAGYSSFLTRIEYVEDLGDSEQTPVDLAANADYLHLTAMLAPRAALLTFNLKDNCCFASPHALPPLLATAEPIYKLFDKPDRLRSHINEVPGTHNFEIDNRQALYKVVGEEFFAGSADFDATEIACQDELKSAEKLAAPLPEKNATFHSIALDLAKDLPRTPKLPEEEKAARAWQQAQRAKLAEVVKDHGYNVQVRQASYEKHNDLEATYWQLRIGDTWTVPAVELKHKQPAVVTKGGHPKPPVLVVAEGGRTSAAAQIEALLGEGRHVIAIDPFYYGESKIETHDFLYALLVSSCGERPLGIQANQLGAAARWPSAKRQLGPVEVVAIGPRASLAALVAAGLESDSIGSLTLLGSLGSLKEILEQNRKVDEAPEYFTFGLLEAFDIPELFALTAPRKLTLVDPSERLINMDRQRELLKFYKALGSEFGPLSAPAIAPVAPSSGDKN